MLEYLTTNLEILNKDNESILCMVAKSEVIDFNLCSREMVRKVAGWGVSHDIFVRSQTNHLQIY